MISFFVLTEYRNRCGDSDLEFYIVQEENIDKAKELFRNQYGEWLFKNSVWIEVKKSDSLIGDGHLYLGEYNIYH